MAVVKLILAATFFLFLYGKHEGLDGSPPGTYHRPGLRRRVALEMQVRLRYGLRDGGSVAQAGHTELRMHAQGGDECEAHQGRDGETLRQADRPAKVLHSGHRQFRKMALPLRLRQGEGRARFGFAVRAHSGLRGEMPFEGLREKLK